jgi:DNA-binding beta-propeller fold protein YncE
LYVYNQLTQELIFLDAATSELKKSVATPQVSPGDAWLVWDKFSDIIIIASEADEQAGYPFVVIDAATGKVLDTRNEDPGGIALHPAKSWLYLSFFRRDSELLVYDTRLHRLVAKAPTPERLDRMIFAVVANELELLVPSPVDSVILRFNAETLERKGAIKTLFGARAIAVDAIHNLIVCGSLVTNRLEVIDLTTQQRIAEYYVGPWQRTITLDSQAGIVYVSTHEGIFKVNYLK